MSVPPHILCSGVRSPTVKALNGVYEFQGVVHDRPCYRQVGVSSGNFLWFAEESSEGPMWVITHKTHTLGDRADHAIARSHSRVRWPWEADPWVVCKAPGVFAVEKKMAFAVQMPAAELLVQAPMTAGDVNLSIGRYRCAGQIGGRPCFKGIDEDNKKTRLCWMEGRKQWFLANVRSEGDGGIESIILRSLAFEDVAWAAWMPWAVEAHAWETPSCRTFGMDDGDAVWDVDERVNVRMSSPAVSVSGTLILNGIYEPKGMINGRVVYVQVLHASSLETAGPVCLWFAEDRGQWVMTGPDQLGDSRVVRARIPNRATWPWEAQHGGTTSPFALGAAPFAAAPEWQGSAAMLSGSRVDWEELAEADGTLQAAPEMSIDMVFGHRLRVYSLRPALYHHMGEYDYAGLISSRPFFAQRKTKNFYRYVMWFSEAVDHWLITQDFKLLDHRSADARAPDSAWFPWEVASPWEVSDSDGGWLADTALKVEPVGIDPEEERREREAEELALAAAAEEEADGYEGDEGDGADDASSEEHESQLSASAD